MITTSWRAGLGFCFLFSLGAIISSNIPSSDQSIFKNSLSLNQSIFDTSNSTRNSAVIDKFDSTLVPTVTSDYKEQLILSELFDN